VTFLSAWAPLFGAASACVFIGLYTAVAPWWASPEGRAVAGVAVTFLGFCVHDVMARAGAGFAVDVVGLSSDAGAGFLMVRLSALVWDAQVNRKAVE